MAHTVLFCHGCNEKFAVPDASGACPQCGQTLAPLADAPTQDFSDLADRGTYGHGPHDGETIDDTLVGRNFASYFIEAFVGKGGIARVYRAKHLMLERPCAIKILSPQLLARRPEFADVFLAEARAAASLVHPHVVTVHNIGQSEGLHFIELEYVVGNSLERLIQSQGRLDPTRATELLLETCSALAQAHRMGMVHRDVKPANILVTDAGVAKLADFGLAKHVVAIRRPTGGRGLVGTPYYMAPELFDGEPADPRSDVYAMGVTYFYLLTGGLPYVHAKVPDLARLHAQAPIPDPAERVPAVPADASAVVRRCLAKRREQRYRDAAELHAELRAVYGKQRSLQSLVREALVGSELEGKWTGDRCEVLVALPGGRSQRVFIEASSGEPIADRLVKIFSLCAPAAEGFYRRALELNAVVPHGSIAIERINGHDTFVMGNTYPRATCDPEEIRRSVLTIAQHADQVERCLTAQDKH